MNQLQRLKLRQARRAERPYTAVKLFAGVMLLFIALGFLQNCGRQVPEKPITKAEKKKYVDSLWAGTADNSKYRLP